MRPMEQKIRSKGIKAPRAHKASKHLIEAVNPSLIEVVNPRVPTCVDPLERGQASQFE